MAEYNLLTKRLLVEGYTAEDHPDYVYIDGMGKKSLDNFHGGFSYYFWYVAEKTYKTPCGMQCKGKFAHAGLSWLGGEYNYENDCPIIICPKGECDCQLRDEPFKSQGTGVLMRHCIVHPVDEEYHYEGSCEAERHLLDDKIRRDKTSFILEKNHHVCEDHMMYNQREKKWEFHYNPMACANGFCRAQTSDFQDGGWCPVLNKHLSKDKGNVFYDVKYSGRDYTKDGTLFEGERFEHIIKGKQLFNKSIRLDIARVIANLCQDEIKQRARWNTKDYDCLTFFRAERGEIDFSWEVLNIRAEKKVSRDLEQDLKDIDDGITVTHEFDTQKAKKKAKSDRRNLAKQKRIDRIEKLILSKGYENLEKIEQNRACKLLDFDRIDELEAQRIENMQNQKSEPVQMSLMDYLKERSEE